MKKRNKSKSGVFRFIKMEIWEVSIPFNFQVIHSLTSRESSRSIIVALHTNNGNIGYGEVLARSYLTGETNETVWEDVRTRWWPQVSSLTFSKEAPKEKLYPIYLEADKERKNASYSGIDLAVYDAWSKETNQRIEKVFMDEGVQYRPRPKGVFALLGSESKKLKILCRVGRLLGFKDFKMKVGIKGQDDVRRIEIARKFLGPKPNLYLDANTNWGIEYCIKKEEFLIKNGISCIEQPVKAGNLNEMARIEKETALSVMADESLCTLEDAKKLISQKAASIWNIRIGKVGGFTGFFTLEKMAREHGIDFCCGCLVGESALLYSALIHSLRACSPKYTEYPSSGILLQEQCFIYDRDGELGKRAVFFNRFPKLSELLYYLFTQQNIVSDNLYSLTQWKKKFQRVRGGLGVRLDWKVMKKLTVRYEKLLVQSPIGKKASSKVPRGMGFSKDAPL